MDAHESSTGRPSTGGTGDATAAGERTDGRPAGVGELTVAVASQDEWHQVAQWAADEGWNPGHRDTACFHPTDPSGFFIGRIGGETVSAISIVAYSPEYAFLGYYLVHPGHRGRGVGMATWNAAMPHAGGRTVGLDAVPQQAATYERSGFTPAYRTTRYSGRPERPDAVADAVPVESEHLDAIAAYDRECFPADRRDFLDRWLTTEGHTACTRVRGGRIVGYGVIRPAQSGRRIGPLFADTAEDAEALFDALTAQGDPEDEVFIDVPDAHEEARALVTARGLKPGSHTVRMYTGPVPPTRLERTYGVTTLELG